MHLVTHYILCLCLFLGLAASSSLPQRRAGRHAKRYVIQKPKSNEAIGIDNTMDPSLFKRKSKSTFAHSNVTHPLKRAHDGYNAERDVHPLMYWTQHYNRALSRRAGFEGHGNVKKRAQIARDVHQENVDRLMKRWESLHQRAGVTAPKLTLSKRNTLTGRFRASTLWGTSDARSQVAKSHKSNSGNDDTTDDTIDVTSNDAATGTGNGSGYPDALLRAAQGNTVTPSTGATAQDSEGMFVEANNVGYFADLGIGTPRTTFKVLMDTGSADFWCPSQRCNADGSCGGHQILGSSTSSSFAVSNPLQQFEVTYGTGQVAGVLASDTVALGDGTLSLKNHTFGVNTDESQDFASTSVPFDCLMGLGLPKLSNQGVPTWPESLASAGLISAPQMGYHLATVAGTQDSEITFGGVDSSKYSGSLTEFQNVGTVGYWQGAIGGITVDDTAVKVSATSGILDTGTTLIIAPQADADAVHAQIPGAQSDGQGGYTLPCTTSSSVAFEFGGKSFAMTPTSLLFVPLNANDPEGTCQSSIAAGDITGDGKTWLVGDAFLTNVYLATDITSNRIGLAPVV